MNPREIAMRQEARQEVIECIKEGYDGYYCDLHSEVFDTDFYVYSTSGAQHILEEYGVFDALGQIQEYEKEQFGEVLTDLSSPERVLNMLWYVIGYEELYDMMEGIEEFYDNWNNIATEEINKAILAKIKEKEEN